MQNFEMIFLIADQANKATKGQNDALQQLIRYYTADADAENAIL